MDVESLVAHYGYVIVLIGALLEGEAVLILAAAAARLGYLHFPWVLAAAAIGAFIGDNFYFYLGRRYGLQATTRFPRLKEAIPRIDALLVRWRWGAVIVLRFLYGLRTIGPIAIGAGTMPRWQFVVANAIGAVLWAAIVGSIGFAAGHAAEKMLGDLRNAEIALLALALVVGAAVLFLRFRRSRGSAADS
ncbi:MAG: DedA family protein, partial [Burkholderiaceae bacterium]